ncbi:PACE efflux transporter [Psychrobacter glacincola]|uniref:PACE efflux transporter n=1 Tax=Psychrobacter glacincola TaxID=56810 RepID=UPI00191B58DD|nr:PACE efflux transporter [Psychrobacter glacincola]
MRTVKDRIRHTLGFEIIGLIIFVPLASWLFGFDIQSIGLIAVAASIIATLWNYFYNLLFDHSMLKLRGNVHKTVPLRMLHAFLFEGGLLLLFLPIIAWHLGISLWQAFIMDITMATFTWYMLLFITGFMTMCFLFQQTICYLNVMM